MVLTLRLKKKMHNNIRKISIGSDYKNDAMHYAVGQQVYGGHEISHILLDDTDKSYNITKYCHGKNLTLTWQYQLNMI